MNRDDIKKDLLSRINNTGNRIALEWCTSFGKSKMAIDIANKIIELSNIPEFRVLLIVAENAHKENWAKELQKWGGINSFDLRIECYASLKKCTDYKYNLIIFDEAHHLRSDLRLELLRKILSNNVILLSATLPKELLTDLSLIYGKFYSSKVSLQDGIDSNVIPSPKIILVPLTLDKIRTKEVMVKEWGLKKKRVNITCNFEDRWNYIRRKDLYPHVSLSFKCTEQDKYNLITQDLDYWRDRYMHTRKDQFKLKWLSHGSIRKRYLGELKTEYAKKICDKLQNKGYRYICFCTSIDQAVTLGGDNAIHSKNSETPKIIKSFNNKDIDNLYAVGMLQEGQNLNDIQAGVIIQLDNEERAFIQKFGRVLRADSPKQYILYYKNTRDEEYLKKVLKDIKPEYITTLNTAVL